MSQYIEVPMTFELSGYSRGHEVLGLAQVLDSANDVEEIGNAVALANAKNSLWPVIGSIAKVLL